MSVKFAGRQVKSVTVIGAGIVGLACARALQLAGFGVTLIDPAEPASGASGANAGIIAGSAVIPEANERTLRRIPRLLFGSAGPVTLRLRYLPRLSSYLWHFVKACHRSRFEEHSRSMAALSLNGFDHWMKLLNGMDEARGLFRREGCLYLYLSQRERADAEFDNQTRRARGMSLVDLSRAEVANCIPDLTVDTAGAIRAEGAGHVVSPGALVRALLEVIIADGGVYRAEAASELITESGRVTHVRTSTGSVLPVSNVVLSAGAYSSSLAKQLGVDVPLDTQRGYFLMAHEPGIKLALPMIVPSMGIAVTPMRDGVRFAGLVEFAGLDAPACPALARMLKRSAARLFPALNLERCVEGMARRPSLPDGLPVIDRAPDFENAFVAFGHGQMGLTQAAITAHLVQALIENQKPPVDVRPYRVTRFKQQFE